MPGASDSTSSGPTARRDLRTVLIANRGEIAARVARACRGLGLRSVAVHTDLDETAPHVRAADEAVRVAGYLDVAAVVDAARVSGADAVHPGYGFLSERAELAAAVEAAGLVFVGPPAAVMERMGRKDAAREVAVAAGVPVVPSVELTEDGVAAGVGYPLLVKAAAGGGGKGMRVVQGPGELGSAVAAARREAMAAFGDGTLLVERYVANGRHIEVQVLADHHGRVVHLFERDCSTQRRHQKVLEEAPAPTLPATLREAVTAAAVALTREVGYRNAGTVEFLLDVETGEAYFLEMNTRLQVEHPVTELVTGLDLVQLQLRLAAGEPLPFAQQDVVVRGHAIEARVYAEDAFAGFLPQAGTATLVRWPRGARVDAALESGQVVSTAYDPMLGKIIVHGPTREAARLALVDALDDTAVLGLTTNVGFLRTLAASEAFRDAAVDTAWLDRTELAAPDRELPRVFAAWAQAAAVVAAAGHPFAGDGWRLGAA
ncbi:MAG: biotin carboxylase N-terminal domain-containing protein, partial [Nocardioidaceae bacterium]